MYSVLLYSWFKTNWPQSPSYVPPTAKFCLRKKTMHDVVLVTRATANGTFQAKSLQKLKSKLSYPRPETNIHWPASAKGNFITICILSSPPIKLFMLQFPQQHCKETKLVKMKCVLSSVRKGNKTHDGVKWLCEQLTNSRFIKLRISNQNINTNYH